MGKYFVHSVNSNCPLPKIAYPVNYLAQRKMGTTIIKDQQFKPKFLQKLIKTEGETPPRQTQNRQYLCPEICQYPCLLDNIKTPKNSCSWKSTLCIKKIKNCPPSKSFLFNSLHDWGNIPDLQVPVAYMWQ